MYVYVYIVYIYITNSLLFYNFYITIFDYCFCVVVTYLFIDNFICEKCYSNLFLLTTQFIFDIK